MTLEFSLDSQSFYSYEANHVIFPMLLCYLYQTSTTIYYWNTAFFVFSFVAFWEMLEVIAHLTLESFILFGVDNDTPESLVDVVILDLGNGIIGIIIGLLSIHVLRPPFTNVSLYMKILSFLVYGAIFSYLSSFSSCRGVDKCNKLLVPFGNYINMGLTALFSFVYFYTYSKLTTIAWSYTINSVALLTAVSVRWKSSAATVYVVSLFLVLFYGSWALWKEEYERMRRTNFTVLKNQQSE